MIGSYVAVGDSFTEGVGDPGPDGAFVGWADRFAVLLADRRPEGDFEYTNLAVRGRLLDQIVAAGQRLGLMIFSSDRDFTLWPTPGTELTVDLDAVSIELPVVGGDAALRSAWAR